MAFGILEGIGLAGSLLGAVNQYSAGQKQAAALREQARLDKLRADDFLLRTEKNIFARRKQAEKLIGGQQVALADAGVELGTGVSLDLMEDTYLALAEEEELIRDEAEAQAYAIKTGATALDKQASDVSTAGTIGGISTLLGGVAKAGPAIASMFPAKKKTK